MLDLLTNPLLLTAAVIVSFGCAAAVGTVIDRMGRDQAPADKNPSSPSPGTP